MNIGVIVHTKTGTTLKFGSMAAQKLREAGHAVDVVILETNIPVDGRSLERNSKFSITNMPDCAKYDAVLIGGPVWAFSASPVIMKCIKELGNISGKKALPFATMGFPFTFMGGRRAIAMMGAEAKKKGAEILPGKVIPKMFRDQDTLMEKAASEIQACF